MPLRSSLDASISSSVPGIVGSYALDGLGRGFQPRSDILVWRDGVLPEPLNRDLFHAFLPPDDACVDHRRAQYSRPQLRPPEAQLN